VDNPLGIVTDRLVDIDELQPAVLFFGDSYVDGPEPIPNKLPQLLDPLLASHSVVNYGVSGYGVDQIFLRFLDSYKKYQDPIVLIGIQDRDIDRTVMSIRNQQKPVLDIQNGELVTTNTPIGATTEFIRRNPVELKSYLGRFVLMRLRRLGLERPIDRLLGYDKRHEQKLRVNRRILQALDEEAEQAGIRLYAVLFYVENDMLVEDWREHFLKTTLDELQIPYFDTKTYLYDVLAVEGGSVSDYWSDEHGHPNLDGNRVFARGIATWLAARDANGVVLN
jgi:lysophospholipase L1-like esterase